MCFWRRPHFIFLHTSNVRDLDTLFIPFRRGCQNEITSLLRLLHWSHSERSNSLLHQESIIRLDFEVLFNNISPSQKKHTRLNWSDKKMKEFTLLTSAQSTQHLATSDTFSQSATTSPRCAALVRKVSGEETFLQDCTKQQMDDTASSACLSHQ